MGKMPIRLPSYIVAGELAEHVEEEAFDIGSTTSSVNAYSDYVSSGDTIVSKSVTVTERSMIVIVAGLITNYDQKPSNIKRGTKILTKETAVSPINFAIENTYLYLQYATEVVEPGTYTYSLVQAAGTSIWISGAFIKIVAITVE